MKSEFKTNLRAELDYLGLTVKELSEKTGIARGTLNCYLSARASMPPADIAVKIAGALNVTVEYLITGHDNKKQGNIYDHNIRSINKILAELDVNNIETLLELLKILRDKSKK